MNTSLGNSKFRQHTASPNAFWAIVHTPAIASADAQQVIDLRALAQSVRTDRELLRNVIKAASREFGPQRVHLEDALVLLGSARLRAIALSTGTPPKRIRPNNNQRVVEISNYRAPKIASEVQR